MGSQLVGGEQMAVQRVCAAFAALIHRAKIGHGSAHAHEGILFRGRKRNGRRRIGRRAGVNRRAGIGNIATMSRPDGLLIYALESFDDSGVGLFQLLRRWAGRSVKTARSVSRRHS